MAMGLQGVQRGKDHGLERLGSRLKVLAAGRAFNPLGSPNLPTVRTM
jgi:hypothetical protein